MDEILNGTVQIESGLPLHMITSLQLQKGQRICLQLDNIIAYTDGVSLNRDLEFGWANFLLGRYALWYVQGPGEVYLRGYGEIGAEVINVGEEVSFNPDVVIAWAGALQTRLNTSRNPMMTFFAPNDEIVVQSFSGEGLILYQMLGKRHIPSLNDRSRPLAGVVRKLFELVFQ